MSWQRRVLELAAAGGALASLTGCPIVSAHCGNAAPDPCICGRMPATSAQCVAEKTCTDHGGTWDLNASPPPPDAGSASDIEGRCEGYPLDAGRDAPPPDATAPLD